MQKQNVCRLNGPVRFAADVNPRCRFDAFPRGTSAEITAWRDHFLAAATLSTHGACENARASGLAPCRCEFDNVAALQMVAAQCVTAGLARRFGVRAPLACRHGRGGVAGVEGAEVGFARFDRSAGRRAIQPRPRGAGPCFPRLQPNGLRRARTSGGGLLAWRVCTALLWDALRHGEAYVTADVNGAACWLPPSGRTSAFFGNCARACGSCRSSLACAAFAGCWPTTP